MVAPTPSLPLGLVDEPEVAPQTQVTPETRSTQGAAPSADAPETDEAAPSGYTSIEEKAGPEDFGAQVKLAGWHRGIIQDIRRKANAESSLVVADLETAQAVFDADSDAANTALLAIEKRRKSAEAWHLGHLAFWRKTSRVVRETLKGAGCKFIDLGGGYRLGIEIKTTPAKIEYLDEDYLKTVFSDCTTLVLDKAKLKDRLEVRDDGSVVDTKSGEVIRADAIKGTPKDSSERVYLKALDLVKPDGKPFHLVLDGNDVPGADLSVADEDETETEEVE